MKKLTKYFLQGLLYLAPFAITVYIIFTLFYLVDNILKNTLLKLFNVDIPVLGLLIMIFIIILAGIIGRTFIARPFKALFDRFMDKTPFLKVIYSALNDLFSAFVGKEKKFNKPVLVLVNPVSNLEKLGFLTEDDLSRLNETGKVAVYFPHSYNFSGELYIVPKENIKPIDINPAEVMKFIVSAGVSGWEEAETKAS